MPRSSGNCVARTLPMSCQSSRNKSEERSKETDPAVLGLCIFSFICFKRAKKINLLAVETGSNLAILTKRKEKSACALSFELFYFSIDHCIFVYLDLTILGRKNLREFLFQNILKMIIQKKCM